MRAPLRVGVVGAGMVSAHHLPAWRSLQGEAEVVAIADLDIVRARGRAAEFGIPNVYASVQQMLQGERLDAIDIVTPPQAHSADCRAAAAAGVAVLCQKPLAPHLDEALAIAHDVEPRVRLMVHENWRFRPHYRLAKQWLDDACIGELRSGELHARSSGLVADSSGEYPALRRQPLLASLPRMIVAEVLVHHLDIARWLSGAGELVEASLRREAACIAGESAASLRLRSAEGVTFMVSGDLCDTSAAPTLRDELRLVGSAGSITLSGERICLRGRQHIDSPVDFAGDYAASYAATIAHFVHALRDGTPFETPPSWHLKVLRTVEDVYRRCGAS